MMVPLAASKQPVGKTNPKEPCLGRPQAVCRSETDTRHPSTGLCLVQSLTKYGQWNYLFLAINTHTKRNQSSVGPSWWLVMGVGQGLTLQTVNGQAKDMKSMRIAWPGGP